MLTNKGEVVGIKDPHGFRPLCLGKLNGHYILASESCALDLVHAELIRELDPGEIVIAVIGDVHKNISLKFFHIFWCSFFKYQLEDNSVKTKHLFTIRMTGTYKVMYVP